VAYGPDGQLAGALDGYIFFDWLTVGRLWVAPERRGSGTGTALLLEAETQAKSLGCVGSTLSTYDFQARPFYEKHGYQVFGILNNNPVGHDRFFMSKPL
jgi:GNAT superfamily N-acetyltransferase